MPYSVLSGRVMEELAAQTPGPVACYNIVWPQMLVVVLQEHIFLQQHPALPDMNHILFV